MQSHLHQCPDCRHVWYCDKADCQGDVKAYDGRCIPWRNNNQREMSAMRALSLDGGSTHERKRSVRRKPI